MPVLTVWLVPVSRRQIEATVSVVDIAPIAGGLTSVTFGVIEAPTRGWANATTLTALAIGFTTIDASRSHERRLVGFILPRALARSRQFRAHVGAGALTPLEPAGSGPP